MHPFRKFLKAAWKRVACIRQLFTIACGDPPEIAEAANHIEFWQKEEKRITDQAVIALRERSLKEAKALIQQARVVRHRIKMEFDRIGGQDPELLAAEKDLDQIRCNMLKRIDETIAQDPWKYQ